MIRVMTDNAANLPPELREQYGIRELCLTYTVNGVPADMSAPFDGYAYYEAMRKGAEVKTSMISPLTAREAMEPVLEQGDDVLYIGLSGGVSGTCWGVSVVAQELRERYPERTISVVDSLCASLGQGLLAYYACKKRDEGMSLGELEQWLLDNRLHLCHWFTVDDLMYLKRGGRVSAATAIMGTMLNIKPVLHVDNEGHLINVGKARGRKASIQAMAKKVAELGTGYDNSVMFISHGDCREDAEYLAGLLKEQYGVKEVYINYVGAVIGSHSGPGTLALFFLGEHR